MITFIIICMILSGKNDSKNENTSFIGTLFGELVSELLSNIFWSLTEWTLPVIKAEDTAMVIRSVLLNAEAPFSDK